MIDGIMQAPVLAGRIKSDEFLIFLDGLGSFLLGSLLAGFLAHLIGAPRILTLKGRSLKPLLEGTGGIPDAGIYAEALYSRTSRSTRPAAIPAGWTRPTPTKFRS